MEGLEARTGILKIGNQILKGGIASYLTIPPFLIKCNLPQQPEAAFTEYLVIENHLCRCASHPLANVQRKEVLLARMAIARRGSFLPLHQSLFPFHFRKRTCAGFDQPVLEGIIGWVG